MSESAEPSVGMGPAPTAAEAAPIVEPAPVLELHGIRKSFNKVEVLHGVDLVALPGEIHGLVGANGAGKSTLMKILNGVYQADEGRILIDGAEVAYADPLGARAHGIAMVYQEFSLIASMTVAQNLFLTREPRMAGLLIDDAEVEKRAHTIFAELGVDIDPRAILGSLPVGRRQLVEIAKALSTDARILILDEPTASLSHTEIEILFGLMRRLRERGIAILFISHHLQELSAVCDRVTVLRDGNVALAHRLSDVSLADIIAAMVGRDMAGDTAARAQPEAFGEPVLEARGLSWSDRVRDVSFTLHRGEILGIAGLLGSGRTELLTTLFGIRQPDAGEMRLHGRIVTLPNPGAAIRAGLSLVPEDRRREGMLPDESIRMNVLLPIWSRLTRGGFIDERRGRAIVTDLVTRLQVRMTGIEQTVRRLSGGNQQKVVVAKSLSSEPTILLLDDPTVGIDVQSKRDLETAIRRIAGSGSGVLLVSSEFEELAALCDRVLILRRGSVVGELDRRRGDEISEASLLHAVQTAA
jgi:ribose transport system ATP-binding protein